MVQCLGSGAWVVLITGSHSASQHDAKSRIETGSLASKIGQKSSWCSSSKIMEYTWQARRKRRELYGNSWKRANHSGIHMKSGSSLRESNPLQTALATTVSMLVVPRVTLASLAARKSFNLES